MTADILVYFHLLFKKKATLLNSNCRYNVKSPAPMTAAAFNSVYCSGVQSVCKPLGVLETLSWGLQGEDHFPKNT